MPNDYIQTNNKTNSWASPAAELIGSAIEAGVTSRNARKQREANMELAKYAYAKELEQWDRENLYNSPTEQMKRFKDAGLNPLLMYGKGSAGAGTAATSPKYNKPKLEYSTKIPLDGASMVSRYQDVQLKKNQITNQELSNEQIRYQNQVLSETVGAQIREAKSKARKAGDLAEVAHISKLEKNWQWTQGISQKKFSAELLKTQASAYSEIQRGVSLKSEADWMKQGITKQDHIFLRQLQKQGKGVVNWFKNNPGFQNFRNVGME